MNRIHILDMEGYEDLELVPFLYNTCFGGYGFSEQFLKRLNKRRAAAELPPVKYSHELASDEKRSDPMITALFQEMGQDEASGPGADIEIAWFPKLFIKYVKLSEYDGREHVKLDTTRIYTDLLTEFLEEWNSTPVLTVADLNSRYTIIQTKLARYTEFTSALVKQ